MDRILERCPSAEHVVDTTTATTPVTELVSTPADRQLGVPIMMEPQDALSFRLSGAAPTKLLRVVYSGYERCLVV